MKTYRTTMGVLCCVLFLAGLLSSCSENVEPTAPAVFGAKTESSALAGPAENGKEWTWLFYSAADAPYMFDPFSTLITQEMVRSGDGVNFLFLQDRYEGSSRLLHFNEDREVIVLEEYDEINMGSDSTIYDFLSYAKTNFPAQRYIISFYGHGGAWFGACPDYSPPDVLRMNEFEEGLSAAGGVDFVLFTAPCTMGALESAYQLRGCTDYYVASEHLSGYIFWWYVVPDLLEMLNTHPEISNGDLAKYMVERVWKTRNEWAFWGLKKHLTMSAVKCDRLEALADAVDELAVAYLEDPALFVARIEAIQGKVDNFSREDILDLDNLMRKLHLREKNPEIASRIEWVRSCLEHAVIAECESTPAFQTAGLSIFVPHEAQPHGYDYYVHPLLGLDFVTDTNWDELVMHLVPEASTLRQDLDPTHYWYLGSNGLGVPIARVAQ